jgi:hypothetical protein
LVRVLRLLILVAYVHLAAIGFMLINNTIDIGYDIRKHT